MSYGGRHRAALGELAATPSRDQVLALQAEVSRWYGPSVPADLRISAAPFPIDGKMTGVLAVEVMTLPLLRQTAILRGLTPGSAEFKAAQATMTTILQHQGDVAFVSQFIDQLTERLHLMGDAVGLPPAPPIGAGLHPWWMIGLAVGAIILITRK